MYPPLTTRLYAIRVHFLLAYIVELLLVLLILIQTGLLGYMHNYDESRRGQRREPLIEVCICFDFSDAVGRGGCRVYISRETPEETDQRMAIWFYQQRSHLLPVY